MNSPSKTDLPSRVFGVLFCLLILVLAVQSVLPAGRGLKSWLTEKVLSGAAGEAVGSAAGIGDKLSAGQDLVLDLEDRIGTQIKSNHPSYMRFVLLNKGFQRWGLGMNLSTALSGTVMDESEDVVVRRADGVLTYLMTDADVTATVDRLTAFCRDMEADGRNFLMFLAPNKTGALAPEYDGVVQDYTEAREAKVLELLDAAGVPMVACSREIQRQGMDIGEMFFRTDHHWTPLSGLWACGLFAQALNDGSGYDADLSLFDLSQYDLEVREGFFLGSQGRKVTEAYVSPEDFPLLLPRYSSNLEVFHSSLNRTLTGSIQDTLLAWDVLEVQDFYHRNAYGFYGYGDEGLIQIHNLDRTDGHRLLCLKISVADCMVPWLSSTAEYLDFIDLRLFQGSLREYIQETNPDTVAVIYQSTSFEDKNLDVLFAFD